jgi:hypothetical protein
MQASKQNQARGLETLHETGFHDELGSSSSMFKHEFFPRTEITTTTLESGRTYHTPIGDLPSVTTIIGRKLDHSWLDEWRARIGKEAADAIGFQAANRGTAVHDMAEKYMLNDPNWAKGHMPGNVFSFKQIRKFLDESVESVYGIEYPLYSKILNTAGRSDLPCKFNGEATIVDFKTSKREKSRDGIRGYFIQSTCYALMFEERTGLKVPQIAVVISVDSGPAQLFVERAKTWYPDVFEVFCK